MEGARRDLESPSRSANDIRALLLGEDPYEEVASPPVWDGDGDPPVFFKDPRDAHWHALEEAAVALGKSNTASHARNAERQGQDVPDSPGVVGDLSRLERDE